MKHDKQETGIEFVNRIWGKCTNEEADLLLWHCTAYPCVSVEMLEDQLTKVKVESGGDFALAMKQADKSIREAMKEVQSETT